jgi:hypothetical protein
MLLAPKPLQIFTYKLLHPYLTSSIQYNIFVLIRKEADSPQ